MFRPKGGAAPRAVAKRLGSNIGFFSASWKAAPLMDETKTELRSIGPG